MQACSRRAQPEPGTPLLDASFGAKELIDRERKNIRAAMAREDIPAVGICFVCGGAPVWVEAFGVTDHSSKRSVDVHTLFSIQSTSKNITATAIMLAAQRGLLDLDSSITTYLPGFTVRSRFESNPERKITLRHLLSHRAGFTHEAPVGNNFEPESPSFEAHVRSISQTWLRAPVGERYYYSNLGFDLAGYVLQAVCRKPFAECLREAIFDPLGMADATASTDAYMQNSNRALGHVQGFEAVPAEMPFIPSGGVYASTSDMAEYLLLHVHQGRVRWKPLMDPWVWNEMHGFAFPGAYSLGVAGGDLRFGDTDIRMLNHTGSGMGFGCNFRCYPQAGIGLAVLFNRLSPAAFAMGTALVEEILSRRYGQRKPRVQIEDQAQMTLPQGELQKFAGNWTGRGIEMDIDLQSGALLMRRSPTPVPVRVTAPTDLVVPPQQPDDDATELRYRVPQSGAMAYLEAMLGDGHLDYNDGPNDRPGPDKGDWDRYTGEYWIHQWGRRVQQVKVYRKNGYLYLDRLRLVLEHESGLFFTSDNEAVDFRDGGAVWGNIKLQRV